MEGYVFRSMVLAYSRAIPGSASVRREIKRQELMYKDVIQRQTTERPAWLNVVIAFRTGNAWQETRGWANKDMTKGATT
jgi:hypothetical protein